MIPVISKLSGSLDRKGLRHRPARRAAIATVAVTSGLVLFGIAAPAQAAPSDYCSASWACVWDDTSYQTDGNYAALLRFQYFVTPLTNYNYTGTSINAGNTADSWYNNGNVSIACFFDEAGYAGSVACLNPKTGDGNIANAAGLIQGINWDPNSAKFV